MSEVIAAVTVLVVVIGWIVIGTQRINEQLLVERRAAYHLLLDLARKPLVEDDAEKARLTSSKGAVSYRREIEQALTTAELVASRHLYESHGLRTLRDAGLSGGVPDAMREAFLELVREESIRNSWVLRTWHFRQYRQKYDVATLSRRGTHVGPTAAPDGS